MLSSNNSISAVFMMLGLIIFNVFIRIKSLYQNDLNNLIIILIIIGILVSTIYYILKKKSIKKNTKNGMLFIIFFLEIGILFFFLYSVSE